MWRFVYFDKPIVILNRFQNFCPMKIIVCNKIYIEKKEKRVVDFLILNQLIKSHRQKRLAKNYPKHPCSRAFIFTTIENQLSFDQFKIAFV